MCGSAVSMTQLISDVAADIATYEKANGNLQFVNGQLSRDLLKHCEEYSDQWRLSMEKQSFSNLRPRGSK
jgi:hypothetical protein